MKEYFAYIRVSTVRQGEKGSSLQEQRSAIEAYSRRHGLNVAQWYEEQETAAKLGRPVFARMLRELERGHAAGVITHKIDRSARNLKDWAALGELHDRGIELHFAHESIDLSSRGGRLSADIQAVVAADYIRNLREEVRKGFYGRLKQGLYPLKAPIGYLDQGGGKPKAIDPVKGPLVASAFELYATGNWSIDTLREEMHLRGLHSRHGGRISRDGWSTILNNPFYIGLIRIRTAGETYSGIHMPLVDPVVFKSVQRVLSAKSRHRTYRHRYRYQRMIRCKSCSLALIAERQKGRVYYRCHSSHCRGTSLREDRIDDALRISLCPFRLTEEDWLVVERDVYAVLEHQMNGKTGELKAADIAVAAVNARLDRLTDAFLDGAVDKEAYLERKERLLYERASLLSRRSDLETNKDGLQNKVQRILELIKRLGTSAILENGSEIRDILKATLSNFTAFQKNLDIAWRNPFQAIANSQFVSLSGPHPANPRTDRVCEIAELIMGYCDSGRDDDQSSLMSRAA